MKATLTMLPRNVCRIEGVPRLLVGKLMVRILNAHELQDWYKLAPSEDETAVDVYGIDYEGREVVRGLIAELEAQEVLRHLPPAVQVQVQAQLSGG